MSIALEMDLARNTSGRLRPAVRKRLEAYYDDPCSKRWDDVFTIIVGSDGFMTCWQAWIATDQSAPRCKPFGEPWSTYPTRAEFRRLLAYATH